MNNKIIDTHLTEELKVSGLVLEKSKNEIITFKPGDQFDILDYNVNFVNLYRKYFAMDSKLEEIYNKIVTGLIDFSNNLSEASYTYTFIRRIKESLSLLQKYDPLLQYSFVNVVNMMNSVDVEFVKSIRTSIEDYENYVVNHVDISQYFGSSLLISDIYELTKYDLNKDGSINIKIKYALNNNSKFNTMIAHIFCKRYEVSNITILNNFIEVFDFKKSNTSTIEKFKDYIQLITNESVIADTVIVELRIKDFILHENIQKYILATGKCIVSNLFKWNVRNVTSLEVKYSDDVILANFLYTNYNSTSMGKDKILLPNIDESSKVNVKGLITIDAEGVNTFHIHPIPKAKLDSDPFLIYFSDDLIIDANSSYTDSDIFVSGDMLYIGKDAFYKYNLSIAQELKIEYIPENPRVSKWYSRNHVFDIAKYQHIPDMITCKSVSGDYWSGTLLKYTQSRYMGLVNGELIEFLNVADNVDFQISEIVYSESNLYVREFKRANGEYITFPFLYGSNDIQYLHESWAINGSTTLVMDIGPNTFKLPIVEYYNPNKVDGENPADGGFFDKTMGGTPIRISLNNKAKFILVRDYKNTPLRIFYKPMNAEDVVSNIKFNKVRVFKTKPINGMIKLPLNETILEEQVFKWDILKDTFVHPLYNNVRYIPVEITGEIISKIEINEEEGMLDVTLENTSIEDEVTVSAYRFTESLTSGMLFDRITYDNTPVVYLGLVSNE